MKTVVEQLLDRINQLKVTCDSADSVWLVDMLIRDIQNGTEFDRSFLEMEKEQIIQTYDEGVLKGQLFIEPMTGEQYYNTKFKSE